MARAHMVWGTKEEKARMGTDYCYYRVVTAVNAVPKLRYVFRGNSWFESEAGSTSWARF